MGLKKKQSLFFSELVAFYCSGKLFFFSSSVRFKLVSRREEGETETETSTDAAASRVSVRLMTASGPFTGNDRVSWKNILLSHCVLLNLPGCIILSLPSIPIPLFFFLLSLHPFLLLHLFSTSFPTFPLPPPQSQSVQFCRLSDIMLRTVSRPTRRLPPVLTSRFNTHSFSPPPS